MITETQRDLVHQLMREMGFTEESQVVRWAMNRAARWAHPDLHADIFWSET